MSVGSDAGAIAAASQILALIQEKKAENQDKPDVITVLEEIEKEAMEIKELANKGWY